MRFPEFFRGLDEAQRNEYAERAGTTSDYIRVHLIHARRVPRPELMEALVLASDGQVTRNEILEHFYPPIAKAAQEAGAS